MCVYVYIYIYIYTRTGRTDLGDSKSAARGYCLDIPRFEEPLNNKTQRNEHTFEEQGI